MNFDIHIAQTEAELTGLYQLRYKVYVEELGRTQKYANHELKEIKEPLDDTAHNIVAVLDNKIVGTVRFHFAENSDNSYYEKVYKLKAFERYYPSSLSYVTKLIVLPEFRNTKLALKLAVACYELGVERTYLNIIDCYAQMVPFFLQLGYRFYTENTFHPEYGEVTPMVLLSHDFEHLQKVNSPFNKVDCIEHNQDTESVQFFNENFGPIHQKLIQSFQEAHQIQSIHS